VDWVFYKPIETAKELALQLALVTRRIEQAISDVFAKEQANDYLQRLLESFKRELLPSLKPFAENEKDYSFADIYAQTIAYGLFTARVFRQVRDRKEQKTIPTYFTREDAWDCLPETNPFLRQLFKDVSEHSLDEFGDELSDGIGHIRACLNLSANICAIPPERSRYYYAEAIRAYLRVSPFDRKAQTAIATVIATSAEIASGVSDSGCVVTSTACLTAFAAIICIFLYWDK
jgi:hypothetical protein